MAKGSAMTTGAGTTANTWAFVFSAWLIALAASLSALFIGEVMGQTPCNLCWHQRAFEVMPAFPGTDFHWLP